MISRFVRSVALGCVATFGVLSHANAASLDTYQEYVDKSGNIELPADYKGSWVNLGNYFVKGEVDKKVSYDLHVVYTQPESLAYFRKHDKFPDGAVLIKEILSTKSETLTTGEAGYADELKVTFMMVKDSKNRFPKNKAWGEGWGWALFSPGVAQSQTKDWKGEGFNNCFGCHVPVKDKDWVYLQGYKHTLNLKGMKSMGDAGHGGGSMSMGR